MGSGGGKRGHGGRLQGEALRRATARHALAAKRPGGPAGGVTRSAEPHDKHEPATIASADRQSRRATAGRSDRRAPREPALGRVPKSRPLQVAAPETGAPPMWCKCRCARGERRRHLQCIGIFEARSACARRRSTHRSHGKFRYFFLFWDKWQSDVGRREPRVVAQIKRRHLCQNR